MSTWEVSVAYSHVETGDVAWERPSDEDMASGKWEEHEAYYNTETGETTWERPAELGEEGEEEEVSDSDADSSSEESSDDDASDENSGGSEKDTAAKGGDGACGQAGGGGSGDADKDKDKPAAPAPAEDKKAEAAAPAAAPAAGAPALPAAADSSTADATEKKGESARPRSFSAKHIADALRRSSSGSTSSASAGGSSGASVNWAQRASKKLLLTRASSSFTLNHGIETSAKVMRGSLAKRNEKGFRKSWQERYFVFENGFLFFYRDKESYEEAAPPVHGMALVIYKFICEKVGDVGMKLTPRVKDGSEAILVAIEDDFLFCDAADVDKPKFPKKGRAWHLQAANSAARDLWYERLKAAPAPNPIRGVRGKRRLKGVAGFRITESSARVGAGPLSPKAQKAKGTTPTAGGSGSAGGAGGDGSTTAPTRLLPSHRKSKLKAKFPVEVTETEIRGSLAKRNASGLRKWQERFYIMRDGYLFFYKDKETYARHVPPVHGMALVVSRFKIEPVEDDVIMMTPDVTDGSEAVYAAEEEDYLFLEDVKIETPKLPKTGRVWELQAENKTTRDMWLERMLKTGPPKLPSGAERAALAESSSKTPDAAVEDPNVPKFLWRLLKEET